MQKTWLERKPERLTPSASWWDTLGVVCFAIGMMILVLTPEKSFMHSMGIDVLGFGAVCRSLRSYTLIPCVLLLIASILSAVFGYPGSLRITILSLSAIGGAMLVHGWWKEKQAKTVAERQTHRP